LHTQLKVKKRNGKKKLKTSPFVWVGDGVVEDKEGWRKKRGRVEENGGRRGVEKKEERGNRTRIGVKA